MRVRDRLYGPSKKVWVLVPELKPGMRIIFSPKTSDEALGNSALVQEARKNFGRKEEAEKKKPVVFVKASGLRLDNQPLITVSVDGAEKTVSAIGHVFHGGPESDKHICKKVSLGKVTYSSAGQRGRGRRAHRTTGRTR